MIDFIILCLYWTRKGQMGGSAWFLWDRSLWQDLNDIHLKPRETIQIWGQRLDFLEIFMNGKNKYLIEPPRRFFSVNQFSFYIWTRATFLKVSIDIMALNWSTGSHLRSSHKHNDSSYYLWLAWKRKPRVFEEP